jgi:hypothetical protein
MGIVATLPINGTYNLPLRDMPVIGEVPAHNEGCSQHSNSSAGAAFFALCSFGKPRCSLFGSPTNEVHIHKRTC